MQLVLSNFPGLDLLGRGFEEVGFCVVRGPDKILGGDIRQFRGTAGKFDGLIGGSPCQDFSKARRCAPSGEGLELLGEFCRVVDECRPEWFLLENVPTVPDVTVRGYVIQRLDVRADEFGSKQKRLRHFQFGSVTGRPLVLPRVVPSGVTVPAALATEGKRKHRRTWAEFCELQGVTDLDLPDFTKAGRYKLVGNAVALPVAVALATAIRDWSRCADVTVQGAFTGWGVTDQVRLCACGCGRPISGRQQSAGVACRKRLERARRDSPAGVVTYQGA